MAKKSKVSGMVVFFLGIALLLATFIVALLAFVSPSHVSGFGKLIPTPHSDWGGAVNALGYAVAIALLLGMGSLGGRIATLGISMLKAQPSSEADWRR